MLADLTVFGNRSLEIATQYPMLATAAQRPQQRFLLAGDGRVEEAIPSEVPLHAVAVLDGGAVDDGFEVRGDPEIERN